MLTQSEELKDLAAALSKAQGALENAKQDATNPHLNKSYANLTSIWDAARKPLTENGLAVVQGPGRLDGNVIELTTRLLHASGQWLESTISLPVSKLDAQQCGSAITYARRYALSAMLGICPDDDDDGHSHSAPRQNNQPRPQSQSRPAPGAPPAGASAMAGAASTRTAPTASNSSPVTERVTRAAEQQTGLMPAPESRGDQQAQDMDALIKALQDAWRDAGKPRESTALWDYVSRIVGRETRNFRQLTAPELRKVTDAIRGDAASAAAAGTLSLEAPTDADPNPMPGHAR